MYNLFNSKKINFSGYKIPHPLINELVIRISLISGDIAELKDLLKQCVNEIIKDINLYQQLLQTASTEI